MGKMKNQLIQEFPEVTTNLTSTILAEEIAARRMEDIQEAKKTIVEVRRGEYLFLRDGHPSTWPRTRPHLTTPNFS